MGGTEKEFDKKFKELFSGADINGDGQLNYEEFLRVPHDEE